MADNPNITGPAIKSRGRWYQFSRRTMLIVVTLLAIIPCVYVRWQQRIMAHRLAERRWLEQHGALFVSDEEFSRVRILNAPPPRRLPWLREVFGDRTFAGIFLPSSSDTDAMKRRAESSFPESAVGVWLDSTN
jgi:hypothetical protein